MTRTDPKPLVMEGIFADIKRPWPWCLPLPITLCGAVQHTHVYISEADGLLEKTEKPEVVSYTTVTKGLCAQPKHTNHIVIVIYTRAF